MTQFKEKSEGQEFVSVGLFDYSGVQEVGKRAVVRACSRFEP